MFVITGNIIITITRFAGYHLLLSSNSTFKQKNIIQKYVKEEWT